MSVPWTQFESCLEGLRGSFGLGSLSVLLREAGQPPVEAQLLLLLLGESLGRHRGPPQQVLGGGEQVRGHVRQL